MHVLIQRWDNSAAIRLPTHLLKQMKLSYVDVLILEVSEGVITLNSAKSKLHYRLAELMAKCDLSALEPAELSKWEALHPIGLEV